MDENAEKSPFITKNVVDSVIKIAGKSRGGELF